jgi:hypothetical protein
MTDDPAKTAALFEPPAQVQHLGHISKYHQGAEDVAIRRVDRHDGHLEITAFTVFSYKCARIAKPGVGRNLLAGTEGAIAAAEAVRKNVMAVPSHNLAIVVTGDLLRRAIKEKNSTFGVMGQHSIGKVFKQRTEGQAHLPYGLKKAVLKKPFHPVTDLVPQLAEHRLDVRPLLEPGGINHGPVDSGWRTRKGGTGLSCAVAQSHDDIKRLPGNVAENSLRPMGGFDIQPDLRHDLGDGGMQIDLGVTGAENFHTSWGKAACESRSHLAPSGIAKAEEQDP